MIISNSEVKQILIELYESGNFIGLIDYCNTQIASDESNYLYYGARGKAFYDLGKYNDAESDITKAIELFPKYVTGFFNRSKCYFDLQKYNLAISDIEKAHSMTAEDGFYNLLGLSYSLIDNHLKAIENYDLYLKGNKDKEVLIWKSESCIHLGQLKESISVYEAILLLDLEDIEFLRKIEGINAIVDNINEPVETVSSWNILSFVENIGFSTFNNENVSGIYILNFTNNEYYIGQAKNIKNRLKQHYKKFNDVECVYYKPIVEAFMLEEENKIISLFEKNLLRVRNLKQINFKNIFDCNHQRQWILDINYNHLSGTKFNNQIVREKFIDRFQLLQSRSYFFNFISFVSIYLKLSIPNYIASEYNYWNITCLPNYLLKDNCISRININTVPVLSVWVNEDNSLQVMFIVSKLPFMKYLQNKLKFDALFENIPSLQFEMRNAFEVSEGDELVLLVEEEDLKNAIGNEVILSAIRLFNLRMMNKVGKEQEYRRTISHCLDLSDLIITRLQSSTSEE